MIKYEEVRRHNTVYDAIAAYRQATAHTRGRCMPLKKKKSQPHVQAHLALRASATKELSLPPLQPSNNSEITSHILVIIYTELLHL